jgi:hypothetical protein
MNLPSLLARRETGTGVETDAHCLEAEVLIGRDVLR